MRKKHIVTPGDVFHRLTVIEEVFSSPSNGRKLLAKCACNGNIKEYAVRNIYGNKTVSCGCLQKETMKSLMTKHGLYKDPLFLKYKSMRERCLLKNNSHYTSYTDVTLCTTWENSYEEFKNWSLSNGYLPELQIDRIDNSLGYSPENCRWVTATINQRNRNKTKIPKTSKYLGVCWNTSRDKWVASIKFDSKTKNLGGYLTEELAAIARDTFIKNNNLEGFTLNNVC